MQMMHLVKPKQKLHNFKQSSNLNDTLHSISVNMAFSSTTQVPNKQNHFWQNWSLSEYC